jgi:hypothetical protein
MERKDRKKLLTDLFDMLKYFIDADNRTSVSYVPDRYLVLKSGNSVLVIERSQASDKRKVYTSTGISTSVLVEWKAVDPVISVVYNGSIVQLKDVFDPEALIIEMVNNYANQN